MPDATPDATMIDGGMWTVDVGSSGCPNTIATSEIISGPVTIADPLDLQVLHDIRAITGTVTITLPDVTLPNLSYVGGDFGPAGGNSLSVPSLCYVQGNAYISATALDLSGLRQVAHGLQLANNTWTSLSLPSLLRVGTLLLQGPQLTTVSFPQLTTIDGTLFFGSASVINSIALANFSGFTALTSLSGLNIANASRLSDLTGLENVHALATSLVIHGTPVLVSLRGLGLMPGPTLQASLDTVPALTDISVLSNFTSIGSGGLAINGAFNLTSMDAVSAIPRIDGPISFYADKRLAQIRFDLLTTTEALTVNTNRALTSISMPSLTKVTGIPMNTNQAFYIGGNGALTTIAFPALTEIDRSALIISNPLLPTCQATNLAAQVTIPPPYTFTITGNGTGTCP